MEEKVTESSINFPWLERKVVKINKVGKTELILKNASLDWGLIIQNFNCPWRLLSKKDQETRRYIGDKFTEVCDRLEINTIPGVEYMSDERLNTELHIEIIGIKVTPEIADKIYEKYIEEQGYKNFNISCLIERHPDGHGDFEFTNFVYDDHGNYPKDENGNDVVKEWTYRYDVYDYFYKEI